MDRCSFAEHRRWLSFLLDIGFRGFVTHRGIIVDTVVKIPSPIQSIVQLPVLYFSRV